MKQATDDRWLSVVDVSHYLGIRPGTVYKWVERSALPARKIGRLLKFRRSEIDAWVERRSPNPCAAVPARPDGSPVALLARSAPEIKRRFGVSRIGVFGSAARGEARPDSDVDVLVEFVKPTFDAYMDLKFYLESLFGRKCDLVLADSLKKGVRSNVLAEVVYA